MTKRFSLILLFTISISLIFFSCDDPLKPKSVNAVVVILGRHANANAFGDVYFDEGLRKSIEDTVYGGYIGVVIGDGNPRVIERFDFFKADATTERARTLQVNSDTNLVLNYLRDENIRAEEPENDLLKAIQEACKLLNVFEDKARNEGKTIKNKQVIILDNGIVTKGDMHFLMRGINRINFREIAALEDFVSGLTEELYTDKLIPDFSGVDIVFIGLGDVANPQEVLSNSIKDGLKNIWTAIFNKGNANRVDFKDYPRGTKPDEYLTDNTGFPYVTPIRFERFINRNEEIIVYSDEVSFVANSASYINQENAELVLRSYTELLNSYLRQSGTKIYVVGSVAEYPRGEQSIDLSTRRAMTVKDTLVKFGLPEDRLEAFGLGILYPDREDEWLNNDFIEEIARNNRKVVLIPSQFTDKAREVLAVRERLSRR